MRGGSRQRLLPSPLPFGNGTSDAPRSGSVEQDVSQNFTNAECLLASWSYFKQIGTLAWNKWARGEIVFAKWNSLRTYRDVLHVIFLLCKAVSVVEWELVCAFPGSVSFFKLCCSVQTAVIKVFQGGSLQTNELYTLNESIRWEINTRNNFTRRYDQVKIIWTSQLRFNIIRTLGWVTVSP